MNARSTAVVRFGPLAALAIIASACAGTTTNSTAPTIPAQTTSFASFNAAVTEPASIGTGPIPEGTYRSQPVPVAAITAKIDADTTLTAAQKADDANGFAGHQTQTIQLTLRNGQFTVASSFDGGRFDVGARATYAFPDDHTLVIEESCCGLSTFDLTVGTLSFTLRYRVGAPNAGEDVIGQTIYQLSPFTLVP